MKKNIILCVFIIIMSIITITGCSKKEDKKADKRSDNIINSVAPEVTETPKFSATQEPENEIKGTEKPSVDEGNDKPVEEPKFTYDGKPIVAMRYQSPFANLEFDRPRYQYVNMGYTELFNRNESLFLSFTGNDDKKSSDLKAADVWDVIGGDILEVLKYDFYGSSGYEIIMDEKEEMTINGIDCMRFEGKLRISYKDEEGYDEYAVGYTFVKDDMPCAMFGVVVEKEQLEANIDEVENNIDEMMKSIREYE